MYFHGTRVDFNTGDMITPAVPESAQARATATPLVFLTPDLDAAIWESELAEGEAYARVYRVEPVGAVHDVTAITGQTHPGHPWMSWCSRDPLRVVGEVTEWTLYHGTRADLNPGALIQPGRAPNFGDRNRVTTHVYFSRTLDAATWGAELADGDGRGHIYIVEPTGPFEEDPDLTNKKFRGNPTKSFRSQEPLRVIGEVTDWKGHAAELLAAMKAGIARLQQRS